VLTSLDLLDHWKRRYGNAPTWSSTARTLHRALFPAGPCQEGPAWRGPCAPNQHVTGYENTATGKHSTGKTQHPGKHSTGKTQHREAPHRGNTAPGKPPHRGNHRAGRRGTTAARVRAGPDGNGATPARLVRGRRRPATRSARRSTRSGERAGQARAFVAYRGAVSPMGAGAREKRRLRVRRGPSTSDPAATSCSNPAGAGGRTCSTQVRRLRVGPGARAGGGGNWGHPRRGWTRRSRATTQKRAKRDCRSSDGTAGGACFDRDPVMTWVLRPGSRSLGDAGRTRRCSTSPQGAIMAIEDGFTCSPSTLAAKPGRLWRSA